MQPSHCSYFDCGVNDLQQNHLSLSLSLDLWRHLDATRENPANRSAHARLTLKYWETSSL